LQVVGDSTAPDLAEGLDSTRVGRFEVEDRFLGDERTFAEARFDLISPATAQDLAAQDFREDATGYALIADPVRDGVARSLSDPTQVLF